VRARTVSWQIAHWSAWRRSRPRDTRGHDKRAPIHFAANEDRRISHGAVRRRPMAIGPHAGRRLSIRRPDRGGPSPCRPLIRKAAPERPAGARIQSLNCQALRAENLRFTTDHGDPGRQRRSGGRMPAGRGSVTSVGGGGRRRWPQTPKAREQRRLLLRRQVGEALRLDGIIGEGRRKLELGRCLDAPAGPEPDRSLDRSGSRGRSCDRCRGSGDAIGRRRSAERDERRSVFDFWRPPAPPPVP